MIPEYNISATIFSISVSWLTHIYRVLHSLKPFLLSGGYDGQPLCLEVSKMHLKYDDGEIVTEAFEAQPNTGPMSHY